MTETKWTKGEWVYRWDGHVSARCPQTYEAEDITLKTELRPICQCVVEAGVSSVTEEDKANAKLIASAPDLYAALQWLGNEVGIYELDGVYLSKATQNHKMLKFVCDALANARGETVRDRTDITVDSTA